MRRLAPLALLALTACTHNLSLHSREGWPNGDGTANEIGKKVTISLGGKAFFGQYVYDGGRVGFVTTSSTATAFGPGGSATAFGSGNATTYLPGSGQGRIFATAFDGDALRCEFQFSGGSGLGVCQDNRGKFYDLQIHN